MRFSCAANQKVTECEEDYGIAVAERHFVEEASEVRRVMLLLRFRYVNDVVPCEVAAENVIGC